MFGAVKKALLRLARQVVQGVMSQLMQQLNIVRESVMAPLRMIIQAVTGGVWRGDGANAFVEEVANLVVPGVGMVGEHISTMHKNLERAVDVIDRADQQVNSKVNSLADVFGAIYNG